jgi:AcrR family transcriptional regulator
MDERIRTLRTLEPKNSGRGSYLAILEAAAGLFGQFPARDITLRDILSIAGVSNQTLYNYFPGGRDDIALSLFDRFQRTMVEDFNENISSINLSNKEEDYVVNHLSASLVRAVFLFLRQSYAFQSNLYEYLKAHNLVGMATHIGELEEAVARELVAHLGSRLSKAELPRVSRLSVSVVRSIADQALMNEDFDLGVLESNARMLTRSLIRTGLKKQEGPSGPHEFRAYTPAPIAIVGAPISPAKRQGILDRILKRKGRG